MNQGQLAVSSGSNAESFIENLIKMKGYTHILGDELSELKSFIKSDTDIIESLSLYGDRVFATQLKIFDNIYQSKMTCDIILYDKLKFPSGLVIEIKWQASAGSVDEKYPFTILTLKNLPVSHTVLILDGDGYRDCAKDWCAAQNTKSFTCIIGLSNFNQWL